MLFIFVALSLLSPLWVFKDLLFPFITSKAFAFRAFIELAFPVYVYLLIKRPDYRPSWKNPLLLAMLAFLAVTFIASFTGVNVTRSLWGNFERMGGAYYLAHLVLLSMYIIILAQIGGSYIKYILYVALGIAALITLNGVSGWLGWGTFVPDPSLPSRVSSTLGNPIFLGSFLIFPMFLSAFFALQDHDTQAKKITLWLLTALLFAGILLSVTRGALVGLISGIGFALVVFIVLHPNRIFKMWGYGILVLFILLFGSLYLFHPHLPQGRLTQLFQLQGGDTHARFIQWRTALKGSKDYPILGVGPENYYFIANKYYNPEIVKYDASWFDKPHNYILEVLITTGVLGAAAYLAIIALVAWALYRAFRAGFLSLLQMCLLLAGFVAYVVQNLFVFDTIPASMMFFVFVGFAVYLWNEANGFSQDLGKNKIQDQPGLAVAAALVSAVVAIYAVYVTNIVPARASKNVNYGYAYASIDQLKSQEYFQSAINSSFNFDLQDTAQRYSDLSTHVAQSQKLDPSVAKNILGTITNFEKQVAEAVGNDPISWQKLANDYYLQAVVNQTALDPAAEISIKKAMALAPNRMEPELLLVQIYIAQQRLPEAQAEIKRLNSVLPLTSYTASARWLEVYADHSAGQDDPAAVLAGELAAKEFLPQNVVMISWLPNYYLQKKDYAQVVFWGELGVKLSPADSGAVLSLAKAYAQNNQIDKARETAQKLIDTNAPNIQEAQDFLKTLPAQ